MSESIDGPRTVLITGAARGIGEAIAGRLASRGVRVVINDLPGGGAEDTAKRLCDDGHDALAHEADVTDAAQVHQMFDEVTARVGPVDGLVNNAGTLCRGYLHEFDDAEWRRTMRVNLDSAYLCLKAFSERCIAAGTPGSVVNIASMSYKGMTQQIAYVASKGGMVSLTRGAAMELARHAIRVNAVAPGMIETEMTAIEEGATDSLREAMTRSIPLRRYGQVDEIASVVGFLLGQDSSYITGETLHVSGGARL